MEQLRRILNALGTGYRVAWEVIYQLSRPRAFLIGLLVIAMWFALTTGRTDQAVPYGFLWLIVVGACRILINVWLPLPPARQAAPLPQEQPIPAAVPAVIVVPRCAPEACPDTATMRAQLPGNLRALMT
ncbi:hypothetical protein [Falsiroseomonas sp. CW058]|uniref:hypothetical protein n=1 Tax=Falsiroseomonas sp. CW058 TaxID=3388664 RepID=UPI003D318D5D